jgi:hypothetical protein
MPKHRPRARYTIYPADGGVVWVPEAKRWLTQDEYSTFLNGHEGRHSWATFRNARTANRAWSIARGCPASVVEVRARFFDKKYRGPDGRVTLEKVWLHNKPGK